MTTLNPTNPFVGPYAPKATDPNEPLVCDCGGDTFNVVVATVDAGHYMLHRVDPDHVLYEGWLECDHCGQLWKTA